MTKVSDLIEQGRREEVWQQFCGFLDLTVPEFMHIQERLLREQLRTIADSPLGQALLGSNVPQSVAAFRQQVPLTTYEDYAAWMDEQREDVLPEKPVAWAHTSGRSGRYKWAPYMPAAYRKMGEVTVAALMLCTARQRGDVHLRKGDVFVYNTPPRPYLTAHAMNSLAQVFDFTLIPPLDVAEDMDFQGRIELSFRMALKTGMDVMGSMSSVMVRIGERFAHGGRTMTFSRDLIHPRVIARIAWGLLRSKLEGRSMLPRDLWKLKGAMAGGTDTSIYRPKLADYWGVEVHEQYGATESGIMATQAWDRRGMYFFPDVAFYEFVPEEEWERSRRDTAYIPRTVLIDEVQPGRPYELVITNLHGGPFLRYRMHDLIVFTSSEEREPSIPMPSFFFKGRSADLIDLAGFTGLIDEKSMWQVLVSTGLVFEEWAIRKEVEDHRPILHLYIELREPVEVEDVRNRVDEILNTSNRFYADVHTILGYRPLRVTLLPRGTFQRYMRRQQAAGADLAHLKPPHLNAPDTVIEQLIAVANSQR